MFDGKKYAYRALPYSGKSSAPIFTKDSITPNVTVTVNNIVVANNQRQLTPIVFPFGFCSIPNNNTQMIVMNAGLNGQNPIAIGCIKAFADNNPLALGAGESANYSNGWAIKYGNNAVQAYKLDISDYLMTLPAGEWLGKFITDIITRLTAMETYLNTHVHIGVTTGSGDSGIPLALLPSDPDLTADQTYINNGNYLLGPNAEVLP